MSARENEIKAKLTSGEFAAYFSDLVKNLTKESVAELEEVLTVFCSDKTSSQVQAKYFNGVIAALANLPVDAYMRSLPGGLGKPFVEEYAYELPLDMLGSIFRGGEQLTKLEIMSVVYRLKVVVGQLQTGSTIQRSISLIIDDLSQLLQSSSLPLAAARSAVKKVMHSRCSTLTAKELDYIRLVISKCNEGESGLVYQVLQNVSPIAAALMKKLLQLNEKYASRDEPVKKQVCEELLGTSQLTFCDMAITVFLYRLSLDSERYDAATKGGISELRNLLSELHKVFGISKKIQVWSDQLESQMNQYANDPGKVNVCSRCYTPLQQMAEELRKKDSDQEALLFDLMSAMTKVADDGSLLLTELNYFLSHSWSVYTERDHILSAKHAGILKAYMQKHDPDSAFTKALTALNPGEYESNLAVVEQVADENTDLLGHLLSIPEALAAFHRGIRKNNPVITDLIKAVGNHCPEILTKQSRYGYTALHAAAENASVIDLIVSPIPRSELMRVMAVEAEIKGATPLGLAAVYAQDSTVSYDESSEEDSESHDEEFGETKGQDASVQGNAAQIFIDQLKRVGVAQKDIASLLALPDGSGQSVFDAMEQKGLLDQEDSNLYRSFVKSILGSSKKSLVSTVSALASQPNGPANNWSSPVKKRPGQR